MNPKSYLVANRISTQMSQRVQNDSEIKNISRNSQSEFKNDFRKLNHSDYNNSSNTNNNYNNNALKTMMDVNDDRLLNEIQELKHLAKQIPQALNSNNSVHLENIINNYSQKNVSPSPLSASSNNLQDQQSNYLISNMKNNRSEIIDNRNLPYSNGNNIGLIQSLSSSYNPRMDTSSSLNFDKNKNQRNNNDENAELNNYREEKLGLMKQQEISQQFQNLQASLKNQVEETSQIYQRIYQKRNGDDYNEDQLIGLDNGNLNETKGSQNNSEYLLLSTDRDREQIEDTHRKMLQLQNSRMKGQLLTMNSKIAKIGDQLIDTQNQVDKHFDVYRDSWFASDCNFFHLQQEQIKLGGVIEIEDQIFSQTFVTLTKYQINFYQNIDSEVPFMVYEMANLQKITYINEKSMNAMKIQIRNFNGFNELLYIKFPKIHYYDQFDAILYILLFKYNVASKDDFMFMNPLVPKPLREIDLFDADVEDLENFQSIVNSALNPRKNYSVSQIAEELQKQQIREEHTRQKESSESVLNNNNSTNNSNNQHGNQEENKQMLSHQNPNQHRISFDQSSYFVNDPKSQVYHHYEEESSMNNNFPVDKQSELQNGGYGGTHNFSPEKVNKGDSQFGSQSENPNGSHSYRENIFNSPDTSNRHQNMNKSVSQNKNQNNNHQKFSPNKPLTINTEHTNSNFNSTNSEFNNQRPNETDYNQPTFGGEFKNRDSNNQNASLIQSDSRKSTPSKKALVQKNEVKIHRALTVMQTGVEFIKYSKRAVNPHCRLVYLSSDETKICWRESTEKNFKFELLSEIKKIDIGRDGPGFRAFQKHDKPHLINHSLVILLNNGKTIQLEAANQETRDQFIENLLLILQQNFLQNNTEGNPSPHSGNLSQSMQASMKK